MKIVKLNNNFKIHRLHRFEIGLKFDTYGKGGSEFESAAQKLLGNEAFMWKYHSTELIQGDWASGFGSRDKSSGTTPYWIYLRKTSMLSMVLLSMERKE